MDSNAKGMAPAPAPMPAPAPRRDADFEVEASTLDDATHAELRMLYAESTATLRFVKSMQWRTVGSTLLVYIGMIAIARLVDADLFLIRSLKALGIALAIAAAMTLIVYQFWMVNELTKIDRMEPSFSNLFRRIRRLKSKREGNIHRYTLLLFMLLTTGFGAAVLILALERIVVYR